MQRLSTDEIGKSYKGRQVVRGVSSRCLPGRSSRPARPQRRGKDHQLLHDRRPGAARRRAHPRRRRRHHPGADVHARPPIRHQLSAPGGFRLPQADRRGEHAGGARSPVDLRRRLAAPAPKSSSTSSTSAIFARPAATSSPAANAGASRSPAASASSPPSSCSTSPFRESTPSPSPICRK